MATDRKVPTSGKCKIFATFFALPRIFIIIAMEKQQPSDRNSEQIIIRLYIGGYRTNITTIHRKNERFPIGVGVAIISPTDSIPCEWRFN